MSQHPHSGTSFLAHDPTPVDPLTLKYEPSSGPRTRRPGYVNKYNVMTDEPTRPVRAPPQDDGRRYNRVNRMQNEPGRASSTSDFFSGMHSTSHNPDTAHRRKPQSDLAPKIQEQRRELNDFMQADLQVKAEQRARMQQEKLREREMAQAFDPWTKPEDLTAKKEYRRHSVMQQAHTSGTDESFLGSLGSNPQQQSGPRTHSGRQRARETKMANYLRFNIGAQALPAFRDRPAEPVEPARAPRHDILIPRRVVDREARSDLAEALTSQIQTKTEIQRQEHDYHRNWAPDKPVPRGGSYADIAARKRSMQQGSAGRRSASRDH